MFRKLFGKKPEPVQEPESVQEVEQEPEERITVHRQNQSMKAIMDETTEDSFMIGRTMDEQIAMVIPGHALPTIFTLVLRHGNSICELVNSIGYYVDNMVNDGSQLTPIETIAKMAVDTFKANGHGPFAPYPLIPRVPTATGRDDRFIAVISPAQFVELYSSYDEMMQSKPSGLSAATDEAFTEVHNLFKAAMNECIKEQDIMSTMGGGLSGNA